MNRMIPMFAFVIALSGGSLAFADDSTTPPASKGGAVHQAMKACMEKAKAANNGMSEEDMKKSCRDQIKANVDHPDQPKDPVVPAH
jgi:hypothetical protein